MLRCNAYIICICIFTTTFILCMRFLYVLHVNLFMLINLLCIFIYLLKILWLRLTVNLEIIMKSVNKSMLFLRSSSHIVNYPHIRHTIFYNTFLIIYCCIYFFTHLKNICIKIWDFEGNMRIRFFLHVVVLLRRCNL